MCNLYLALGRDSSIHQMPRETVRKALIGPELKPQKASKRVKKPYFATAGQQNGGSSGYSRPFSDSFRRGLLGNSVADFKVFLDSHALRFLKFPGMD